MKHIVLGATGRLAKEVIVKLRVREIEPLLVSSKNEASILSLSSISDVPCVIYDFMSASRPGSIGDVALEDKIRHKALMIPLDKIKRYIYISSAGELYKGKGSIKHQDDWRLPPELGPYALRKLEVERLLLTSLGDKARVLRVTNIYGGNFKSKGLGVVDNWLAWFIEGRQPDITTVIDTHRNYIHVDCVVEEIISEVEEECVVVLDTDDYFFLSDIYDMIFNQELTFSKVEKKFDLSFIAKRKKPHLQRYIRAIKNGDLHLQ